MRRLNPGTRAYIAATVVLALALGAVALGTTPHHGPVIATLTLALLAALADGIDLEISRDYRVSVVPVLHIALILTLPPGLAVLVALAAALIEQIGHQRPAWYKSVFNVSHHVLIVTVPALLLHRVWPAGLGDSAAGLADVTAVAVVVLLYYLLDTLLLGSVLALALGTSLRTVLVRNNLPTALLDLTLGSTGALLGIVWALFPPIGLLVVPPMLVTHLAYRNLKRLERETFAAVETMADIVDARDPYTAGHCVRVATYAGWIAAALDLSTEEVAGIVSAARVHDLGKIAIPDAILLKPGALTPDEYAIMKRHSDIGADLLAKYSIYARGAELVRHHHEHVNGAGYPTGLIGTDVPLGARIIAVADAFDAMTTDRPYRRGLGTAAAIAELERGAGRQWDADLVRIFVDQVRTRYRPAAEPVACSAA